MVLKVIKPVDGTAKSAAISKYASDRQGGERGRRQQLPDSYKPKPEKKEPGGFDQFFASDTQKPVSEFSEFELLLKKMWEDNNRMKESAKALEKTPSATMNPTEAAYLWGINYNYRPIMKK